MKPEMALILATSAAAEKTPAESDSSGLVSQSLTRRISAGCNENVYRCLQCKRCTAGCPAAHFADLHPAQIIRAAQLGDEERALGNRFLWLCTGCQTCSARCPQSIDVASIIDELRKIARERGLVSKDAPYASLLRLNVSSIRRWGRLYETELFALDKLTRPASFTRDLRLGAKLILKRKIKLLPETGDRAQMKRMMERIERIEAEDGADRVSREDSP